jgi:hypothetical protein
MHDARVNPYLRPKDAAKVLSLSLAHVQRLASEDQKRISQGQSPIGPPFYRPAPKVALYPSAGLHAYVESDTETLRSIWARVLKTPHFLALTEKRERVGVA